jgi:uncharacterized protein YjiS (DUF1127 family)
MKALATVWQWIDGYLARRRARHALQALPDRMLRDIGLRRDQIEEIRVSLGDTGARALRAATDRRD